MSKRVQVTLTSDHVQTIQVEDDYALPPLDDEWVRIDAKDGGEFAFPSRLVVAIVLEGSA